MYITYKSQNYLKLKEIFTIVNPEHCQQGRLIEPFWITFGAVT